MTREQVLSAFPQEIQKGDLRSGDSTTEKIKKTVKTLIIKGRTDVIEALRYWLRLRDRGLAMTVVIVIANNYIPELKPDLECLRAEIQSGKVFHPSYNYLVDLALKPINEKPNLD